MGGVPKMPVLPPALVVAVVASIFSALASPCTAAGPPPIAAGAEPKPLVANLIPSAAAQDFIRDRCSTCERRPDAPSKCFELLLPYATSINGSYNRVAAASVIVMVSKLTAFVEELRIFRDLNLDECIKVVTEAIDGAKEPLAKLGRIDAMGDAKVDAENPDLNDVMNWIAGVHNNFQKCWDGDHKNFMDEHPSAAAADYSVYTAHLVIVFTRPYWDSSLPSPDGA